MSARADGAIRVGCGSYDWHFDPDKFGLVDKAMKRSEGSLRQKALALGIGLGHPLIHGSVLREATFAGVPLALQHFHEYSQHVAGLDVTDDEKANILLDIYREHERTVNEAMKNF
jgi:hypothetical protein